MEIYYARAISNCKSICISPLTDDQLRDCGAIEQFAGCGYFLYEREILNGDEEIEVLAQILSDEAAKQLAGLLGCADPRHIRAPLPVPLPLRHG